MRARPRTPTLFPYTTLFRSGPARRARTTSRCRGGTTMSREGTAEFHADHAILRYERTLNHPVERVWAARSEEHTSELQSHSDLVCRLLLEKKKTVPSQNNRP